MDPMKENERWFSEVSSETCPGQSFSLEVDHVLHRAKSAYQDILVFQSKTYGRVLMLDGMFQVTERDEFAYQEMLAHTPMLCHPCPKKVLIVGGGDGGILREVLKHSTVESVTQCEIDQEVVNVSKQFLPSLSKCFDDPRLELKIGDGLEFLRSHQNSFDVVITDSSDPVGPGESLFGPDYYALAKAALREGGLLAAQGESIWLHLDFIKSLMQSCRKIFPVVDYGTINVPSYPCGQIGVLLCATDPTMSFREPLRTLTKSDMDAWNLRYYSSLVHNAAFILPHFADSALHSER